MGQLLQHLKDGTFESRAGWRLDSAGSTGQAGRPGWAWRWAAGFLLGVSLQLLPAQWFDTLEEAYSAAGFDPGHPGNAVVVFFSDPHMNLWEDVLPVTTNLDPRLVSIVNRMDPPPHKIIVAGDTSTTLSPVPGWIPRPWSMTMGTNEMAYWLEAIRAITNVAPDDIIWIPGNHDQLAFEEEAETYRRMYPMMPVRQKLDLAGVRFLLINCGNYGGRNPAQMEWLRSQLAQTPWEQPVVVVNHVPPFHFSPWYRGTALELRELFADRPARWWILGGHYHARSQRVYQIGLSTVASFVVGTSNPKNTNGASDDTGFAVLCLSNGIHAVLYYSYNRGRFELVPPPDWENPLPFFAAFEEVPGLLWRRLKAPGNPPEVEEFTGHDSIEWYAYTRELRLRLPLGLHAGQATHFLLLMLLPSADVRLEFEVAPGRWMRQPFQRWTNFVYAIPIPEELRSRDTLRVRYESDVGANDFISGWGLMTTSSPPWIRYPRFREIPEQRVHQGQRVRVELGSFVENPYASYDSQKFQLLQAPSGATLDTDTGLFEWSLETTQPEGLWEVTAAVMDQGTPVFGATQSFRIRLQNRPVLAPLSAGVVVREGEDLVLSAEAWGLPPLSYTWYFHGAPLLELEASNAVWVISNAGFGHAGWYRLVARNEYGEAATPAFRVGVVNEDPQRVQIRAGSSWSFLTRGEPLVGWAERWESEAGWELGKAPFGYGLPGLATLLRNETGHDPCTAYFRTTLVFPEQLRVEAEGRLWCAGGAVVYWNGQELLRHRMPPGESGYGPWALDGEEALERPVVFRLTQDRLRPGTNVLAVQVHQALAGAVPVAYWRFEEAEPPWRDEIHGHAWRSVGTGVARVPGRFGGCVSNSAASGWLEIPWDSRLQVRGGFTVGGWVSYGWGSGNDPESTVIEKPGEFRLYYTGTKVNRFRFRVGDREVQDQTPGTTPGQWRWVVGWFDGQRAYIQVDLGPVYSVEATLPEASEAGLRALHRLGASGGFAVDELFYFPRPLAVAERERIYREGLERMLGGLASRLWFDLELAPVPRADGPGQPVWLRTVQDSATGRWELLVPEAEVPSTLWLSTNLLDWIPVWQRPAWAPAARWILPTGSNPLPEFYRLELQYP